MSHLIANLAAWTARWWMTKRFDLLGFSARSAANRAGRDRGYRALDLKANTGGERPTRAPERGIVSAYLLAGAGYRKAVNVVFH